MNNEPVTTLDIAYQLTAIEHRIDKIRQVLFFYDNVPDDNRIAELIKEWRTLDRQRREFEKTNLYKGLRKDYQQYHLYLRVLSQSNSVIRNCYRIFLSGHWSFEETMFQCIKVLDIAFQDMCKVAFEKTLSNPSPLVFGVDWAKEDKSQDKTVFEPLRLSEKDIEFLRLDKESAVRYESFIKAKLSDASELLDETNKKKDNTYD